MIPRSSIVLVSLYESLFGSTELLWPAYYNGDAYTVRLSKHLR